MNFLFQNVRLPDDSAGRRDNYFVSVKDGRFDHIGKERPDGKFDSVRDCGGELLIPAFYNTHCHVGMTAMRGLGDDVPFNEWLFDYVLPAEDEFNDENVYWGAMLGIAEMLKGGIASFSDMYIYQFEKLIAKAVSETGIKANLSVGLVADESYTKLSENARFLANRELYENFNGKDDGRIIVEAGLHALYSTTPRYCRDVADHCRENGIGIQIHLAESEGETKEAREKYDCTPAEFFRDLGVFDTRVTAAHCVNLVESDMDILAEKHVSVSHNISSNLKLGNGFMPYTALVEHGVNVSFGTDGAASNNSLSILREMQIASLVHKGIDGDAAAAGAKEIFRAATENGALAQGRPDCGKIAKGYRADCVLMDSDDIFMLPCENIYSSVVYGAGRNDILMTMADGKILYDRGEFTTIDIEKVKYRFKKQAEEIGKIGVFGQST